MLLEKNRHSTPANKIPPTQLVLRPSTIVKMPLLLLSFRTSPPRSKRYVVRVGKREADIPTMVDTYVPICHHTYNHNDNKPTPRSIADVHVFHSELQDTVPLCQSDGTKIIKKIVLRPHIFCCCSRWLHTRHEGYFRFLRRRRVVVGSVVVEEE